MVNDFIGQGALWRIFVVRSKNMAVRLGARWTGRGGVDGKPDSTELNSTKEQLHELRHWRGRDFEKWWRAPFGHAFNCLAQSETRYLARSPDVDAIRNRLAAAEREGDRPSDAGSVREQKRHIRELKA